MANWTPDIENTVKGRLKALEGMLTPTKNDLAINFYPDPMVIDGIRYGGGYSPSQNIIDIYDVLGKDPVKTANTVWHEGGHYAMNALGAIRPVDQMLIDSMKRQSKNYSFSALAELIQRVRRLSNAISHTRTGQLPSMVYDSIMNFPHQSQMGRYADQELINTIQPWFDENISKAVYNLDTSKLRDMAKQRLDFVDFLGKKYMGKVPMKAFRLPKNVLPVLGNVLLAKQVWDTINSKDPKKRVWSDMYNDTGIQALGKSLGIINPVSDQTIRQLLEQSSA